MKLLIQILLSSVLLQECLAKHNGESGYEERKDDITALRDRLEDIALRLNKLKYTAPQVALPKVTAPRVVSPSHVLKPKSETSLQVEKDSTSSREPVHSMTNHAPESKGLGFYILPFIGIQKAHDLSWQSMFGELEIKESEGLSGGVRVGYDLRNFFTDFQLSYFQNDMRSINVNIPLDFSGKTEGVGLHISAGGRVHFNEYIAGVMGAGVGGVEQDVSIELWGIGVEESDFLFSYQIFAGLEFRPIDYLIIGLRYRWLGVEEMEIFSSRNHHLAELSLGYVF